MASAAEESAPDPLKSKFLQVSVLKVSIHCEGCKKKVYRILRKVDGVEEMAVDARQNKVTVKAAVDAQTLIQKFRKAGKHAELWPEAQRSVSAQHIARKEVKEPPKPEEQKKEDPPKPASDAAGSPPKEAQADAPKEARKEESGTSKDEPKKKADDGGSVEDVAKPPPTESAAAEKTNAPAEAGGEKAAAKTEKRALKDSNAHPVLATPPAYIMSYNAAQPSVMQSHYVEPAMPVSQGYMYADPYAPWAGAGAGAAAPPEYYYYNAVAVEGQPAAPANHQPPAAYAYNNSMFSDENPNGCSVM